MPHRTPVTSTRPIRVVIAISSEHVVGRRILEGVADYTERHERWQNYLTLDSRDDAIHDEQVDGIIVADDIYFSGDYRNRFKVPTIQVTGVHHPEGLPSVVADNRAVGRMGASYLTGLGLKHLMFVSTNTPYSNDRLEGFIEVATARGLHVRVASLAATGHLPAVRTLQSELASLPEPAGVMAASDRLGLQVSRACRVVGKRIPEHVALIGVDNETEICRLVDPPLTSIDHGTRRIGYAAAQMLDDWLTTGVEPTQSISIQPIGVVSRQSTDLLAIDNPDVVLAVRYIRSNYCEGIKVKDVLRHVAMSRRSLEMHFRATLACTIHEEILRVRIDRAKHLLGTTNCEMTHIANECGFGLASQVSYVFKRETGESPMAYRNRIRTAAE